MIFKNLKNSSFEYKYYLFMYLFCLYFFLPIFEVYFIKLFGLEKYLLQKNDELYKHIIGEIELNISSLKGCDPSELFTSEIENIVNDTIKTLPNRTREIFYERYLEQKSYKTIAENFGISVKGVEFHVTKSLNVLRKKLKDYL
jgi:RNA polymerase sigma-70 factor (ECF subfamily)